MSKLTLEQHIAHLENAVKSSRKSHKFEISSEKEILLKEFLGDFYDDLMVLTNNDKKRILNILEHYANKSGFFERVRAHIEYLEDENK